MKGVQEYYDKTAAEWAAEGYGDEAYLPCLDEFLSLLPPGGRVLDLCCGAGYETGRIRARGFEALALDFSAETLKIARQRSPGIAFYQGDMLEDYAHIGMVDGILLSAGLVHVETADLPRAFARMAAAVRPGGYVLASIREGRGRLEEWSLREIDGERYDRNFIAHTPELASDMPIWRQLLFRRTEADA